MSVAIKSWSSVEWEWEWVDGGMDLKVGRSGVVGNGRELGRGFLGLAAVDVFARRVRSLFLAGPGKGLPNRVTGGANGSGRWCGLGSNHFLGSWAENFALVKGVSIALV